jgi:hypothetical protein
MPDKEGEEMYQDQLKTCEGLISTEYLLNASNEGLVGDDIYESMSAVLNLYKLGMLEVAYDDRVGAVTVKSKEGKVPDGIF